MSEEQVEMTLVIARRVLADETAGVDRKTWADDALRALEHGDIAAARRIGWFAAGESQGAAA